MVPHNSTYLIAAESQCKYNSFGTYMKKIEPQYEVIVKNVTPYPQKALLQLNRGVFL